MGNYRQEIGGIETADREVKLILDTAASLRKLRPALGTYHRDDFSPADIFKIFAGTIDAPPKRGI